MCKGKCNILEPERKRLGDFDWLLTIAWVGLLTFSIISWVLLAFVLSVVMGG